MLSSFDVIDRFLATAAALPDATAISLRGAHLSYAAFEDRVRRFAGAYAERRCRRVMIALPQGADAYAAMFAAGLSGGYYAPLNIEVPLDKLLRTVRVMEPDLIVAGAPLGHALAAGLGHAAVLDPADPMPLRLEGRGTRHDIAYIIFTSGTTGMPKGVVIPRTALHHFVQWVTASGFITPADRVAQFSNIAFDVSVTDIYGALSVGATLFPVVGRADRTFPARIVARERLTVWNSTPSVVSLMMQAGEATRDKLGSLRFVNTCGEALLPAHVAALVAALPHAVLQNSYGPTETTVTMTELRLTAENWRAVCGASVSIGAPIDGMDIQLIGGAHPDEGEIVITGPQLASGYWNDPERSAAAFRTIEVDGVPVRSYFSGDWAERRDGYIFFKERIDLQVKIHGFRLELDEVARVIHDQGFPVTCVLKWRDELAAVIERQPHQPFDELALRARLATQIEAHAIPSVVRMIDRMPRTENDKLDRLAVAAWLDSQDPQPADAKGTGAAGRQ